MSLTPSEARSIPAERRAQVPVMRTNRLALLALALTALEASTSEHHDQIELTALIQRSPLIAVVEPASPPTKKSEIAIAPKGSSKEKYPPYERVQQRYVVKAVLKNEAGTKLAPGATIEVDVGDFDTRLTVHRRYYLEGVRKFPIYSYYRPSEPPDAGAPQPGKIVSIRRRLGVRSQRRGRARWNAGDDRSAARDASLTAGRERPPGRARYRSFHFSLSGSVAIPEPASSISSRAAAPAAARGCSGESASRCRSASSSCRGPA
jgi:hypothetical protein